MPEGKDVGRLEKVIARAVALSPSRRWKTAGDLLRALDAVEPPRAPSPDRDSGTTVKVRQSAYRRAFAPLVSRPAAAAAPAPATTAAPSHPPRDPAAEARQDLAVAGAGVAILAIALGLLAWTFSTGLDRLPNSPSVELAAARRAFAPTPGTRAARDRTPSPWIVPMAAPPVEVPPMLEPTPRRSKTTRPAADAKAPLPPAEAPLPPAEAALAAPGQAPGAAGCSMTINSVPWSEVWIDGVNTALHTPFVGHPIACGWRRLEFKRPDLQLDQGEWVFVKPGEPFKRRFSLTGERE